MRSTLDGPGNEDVNLHVASFSQEWDSLSQWRAYSGPTSGFALGFSADRLDLPERFTILHCIYEPDRQNKVAEAIVGEVLDRALAQIPAVSLSNATTTAWAGLLSELHTFALMFKHPKFHEEEEWRIVSPVRDYTPPAYPVALDTELAFRQGKSMPIPYLSFLLNPDKDQFPLAEVVIGPNPNPEQSSRSASGLLRSERLERVRVRRSEIPYRNW